MKTSPGSNDYTSLFLSGGYFNVSVRNESGKGGKGGKGGWISKLSSDDYYKVAKTVRLCKKSKIHFDDLILSDNYKEEHHHNHNHNYHYLLEQLHIKYRNEYINNRNKYRSEKYITDERNRDKYRSEYITDERFEICRKTLLLLKEDGLLN